MGRFMQWLAVVSHKDIATCSGADRQPIIHSPNLVILGSSSKMCELMTTNLQIEQNSMAIKPRKDDSP